MQIMGPIGSGTASRQRRNRVARLSLAIAALLALGILSACQTSPQATIAAQQLTNTSQQLTNYYADLTNQIEDTITLNQIQAEMLGLPFDDSDRARLNTTEQELAKRAAMAKAMGDLAAAYSALAGSKAPTDIVTAATELAHECGAMKAMPGGPAIPNLVAQAGEQLVELIRTRKLRQSSEGISQALTAIDTLFEKEMPVYESINRQRITLAQSIAVMLVRKDLVDVNPVMAPALKPFDLAAKPPGSQSPAEFRRLAEVKIKVSGDKQATDYVAATQALDKSLKSVSVQVAAVGEKHKFTRSSKAKSSAAQPAPAPA